MTDRLSTSAMALLLVAVSVAGFTSIALAQDAGGGPEVVEVDGAADEGDYVAVPEPSEKAMRYYKTGMVLWLFNQGWAIFIPCVFLFTGLSAKIRTVAQKIGKFWFFTIALYLAIFITLTFLIDLPIAYYQQYVRQHAYDLSNQSLGKWAGDSLKQYGVGLAVAVALAWVPYLLLRIAPRLWWFFTALLAVPVLIAAVFLIPIFFDPMFNDFHDMEDKALETKILALAEHAGIKGSRVYEVDKSEDTKTVNAYVTGFMDSKRVVLWDTILEKLDEDEILFVMGHEMGHYVMGHVVRSIILSSFLILIALYAAHRTAGGLIRRYGHRFGFEELHDIASLPLLILIITVFSLVVSPIILGYTRYQEHEADRFGLEITRDNRGAATAFVKLQMQNLSNPRPWAIDKFMRGSHPPLGERIDFCNEYRPWEDGTALKYERYFKGG